MNILSAEPRPPLNQWHTEGISIAQQAERLECAPDSVVYARRLLAREGLIALPPRLPRQPWTKADEYELDTLIQQGLSYAAIGNRMGRAPSAIYARCRQRGTPVTKTSGMQWAAEVAADLGVSGRRVGVWIARGYLKATNVRATGLPMWRVQLLDLMAFLDNSDYWMLWDPANISDHAYREWALEGRRSGPQWITTTEVARRLHMAHASIHQWIINGWLPAQRRGHIWYIDARNLEAIAARRAREEHSTRSAAVRQHRAQRRQSQGAAP